MEPHADQGLGSSTFLSCVIVKYMYLDSIFRSGRPIMAAFTPHCLLPRTGFVEQQQAGRYKYLPKVPLVSSSSCIMYILHAAILNHR